jgi:hypothetical protein
MPPSYRVTWREWAGVLATCTVSGTVLGVTSLWARHPLPLPYLVFFVLGAFVVALVFALIASVLASIILILVARYGAHTASRLQLAGTGAAAGAVAGALHPFVLLVLITRTVSPDAAGPSSVVPLAVLVAVSGAAAGALLVPRYVPAIRARG